MIVSVRKLRFVWRNNYLLSIRFFLHRIVVLHWRLHLSPHWRKFCTFSCTIEIFILDQVETCPESRIRLYHFHLKEIISVNKKKVSCKSRAILPPPPFFLLQIFVFYNNVKKNNPAFIHIHDYRIRQLHIFQFRIHLTNKMFSFLDHDM